MKLRNNRMIKPIVFLLLTTALSLVSRSAAAGPPTEQIKATVDKALLVLKDPQFKPPSKVTERRDQLRQILFARFDFTEMARRASAPIGAGARPRSRKNSSNYLPTSSNAPMLASSNPTPMKKSSTTTSASTVPLPMSAARS